MGTSTASDSGVMMMRMVQHYQLLWLVQASLGGNVGYANFVVQHIYGHYGAELIQKSFFDGRAP